MNEQVLRGTHINERKLSVVCGNSITSTGDKLYFLEILIDGHIFNGVYGFVNNEDAIRAYKTGSLANMYNRAVKLSRS
jgi:hypothetical protein